jgi:ribosomal-protein-alanine N-acetyltransferase
MPPPDDRPLPASPPGTSVRPTLETARLVLRPFEVSDAPALAALAGAREVAATTLSIPHPYTEDDALEWIGRHQQSFDEGSSLELATVLREGHVLCGSIGLAFRRDHLCAEMGYWIGVPYWGRGYCTEAARALIRHGFEDRGLHRIHAVHFGTNPASGRVMRKIGMVYEGRLREHARKWGVFQDLEVYGILAREFRDAERATGPR